MKKLHIILILCFLIVLTVMTPVIINESYKRGIGYETLWGAPEMLSYAGAVISAIGTIFIGIIAIVQTEHANKINDKLLQMEEVKSTPYLYLDVVSCKVGCFSEKEIDIMLGFRNDAHNVINVISVTPLCIESFFAAKKTEIKFSKWTEYFSILPHQTIQFNFFDETSKDKEVLFNLSDMKPAGGFWLLMCELAIEIKSANSTDIYLQKYKFNIYIFSPNQKKDNDIVIDCIENSICKKQIQP